MNRNNLKQVLAGAAMLLAMLSVSNVNAQSTQAWMSVLTSRRFALSTCWVLTR